MDIPTSNGPGNMPPQPPQQQGPRMPDLDPQLYALLTELDGFLAKAALTRAETAASQQCIQTLVRRLEMDKQERTQLASKVSSLEVEVARLRPATATTRDSAGVVDSVLKELPRTPAGKG